MNLTINHFFLILFYTYQIPNNFFQVVLDNIVKQWKIICILESYLLSDFISLYNILLLLLLLLLFPKILKNITLIYIYIYNVA